MKLTFRAYCIWVAKVAAVLILAQLLIGCAPPVLDQTPVSPIAPTVRKPTPVAPVDLAPVRERTRQVEESNRQLSSELTKNKSIVFDLRRQLQVASLAAVVSPEQWASLKERAEELETSREELETINADQQKSITELNSSLIDSTTQVQLVQGSLNETQLALDDANLNIAALNTINHTCQQERDMAIRAFAGAEGAISEVRKSKQRWMITCGIATLCCVGLAYLLFKA